MVSFMAGVSRVGRSVRVVHIKKAPLYRRRSKSAMIQSIICGFGVRKYTASVSGWAWRLSSMRSMSGTSELDADARGSKTYW